MNQEWCLWHYAQSLDYPFILLKVNNTAEADEGSLHYSKLQAWFTSALICLKLVELCWFLWIYEGIKGG